jgi:putative flippase GtrA
MTPLAARRELSNRSHAGIARALCHTPLVRFVGIGIVSTIAYAILYLCLRAPLGPDGANALALGLTALANTQANRRLTFGVRGRADLLRQHSAGAVVYLLALGLTLAVLSLLHRFDAHPASLLEVTVLVLASGAATIIRYLALRTWVFSRRGTR